MPTTVTNESLAEYFKTTLQPKLTRELISYINTYRERKFDGDAEDIYGYNEEALLSLVKSAILRDETTEEVWAIQEYSVYDEKQISRGSADLFVVFKKHDFTCDVLFEAKRFTLFNGKETDILSLDDIIKPLAQVANYFDYEKKYFISPSFLVTMFFEYLEKKDLDAFNIALDKVQPQKLDYKIIINEPDNKYIFATYGFITPQ